MLPQLLLLLRLLMLLADLGGGEGCPLSLCLRLLHKMCVLHKQAAGAARGTVLLPPLS